MPSLERVMNAAINSMIRGHHSPHCFRAHVPGKGYVNNGSAEFDRADFLKQLERAARFEVGNVGYAPSYAEPGHIQPVKGVLIADWNKLPSEIDKILEKLGYAVEWFDEWTTCSNCNRAMRTSPDCYDWTPAYTEESDGLYCDECKSPPETPDEDESEG